VIAASLFFWLLCAILSAVIASSKGRGGFGWFLLGLIFGIFTLILVAILPNLTKREIRKVRREVKDLLKKDTFVIEEKKGPEIDSFFTKVAGVTKENPDGTNRQDILKQCRVGEPLTLLRDPSNPHDPNAIKVFRLSGEQLGWLSAELATKMAPLLDGGYPIDAQISDLTGSEPDKANIGCNIKLTIWGSETKVTFPVDPTVTHKRPKVKKRRRRIGVLALVLVLVTIVFLSLPDSVSHFPATLRNFLGIAPTDSLLVRTGANVRSGPGTSYPVIAGLAEGSTIIPLEKRGEWINFERNGETGWVHGSLVSKPALRRWIDEWHKPISIKSPDVLKQVSKSKCEQRGRVAFVAVVICTPSLNEAEWREAGKAACPKRRPCNAWIWDDPAKDEAQ